MADGINVQLNDAMRGYLSTIRAQLVATPPSVQAPKPSVWKSAVPTDSDMPAPQPKAKQAAAVPTGSAMATAPADPMLNRLDELMATLAATASIKEGVDTVERLADRMRQCQTVALDMDTRLKFNLVKVADGKNSSVSFSRIRGCIQLAARYYERLAFYRTDKGKKFLKGRVSADELKLDSAGDVAVNIQHLDEQIDPLIAIRHWDYQYDYLPWATKLIAKNSDPIDHIVEFLIGKTTASRAIMSDVLSNALDTRQARLNKTDRVGDLVTVQVRTGVPGDDKYSDARGVPRMWTYQVKVPVKDGVGPEFKLGTWKWTCEVWSDNAASLPILRVVDTVDGPSTRGAITNDFTRGTLYAMRGPSTMRCYPALKFHSALFDAEVTSAAGILVANEGRVVAIDNRSGHYQPGYRQLQTAVQFLQSNLLFDTDAFVSVYVSQIDALYFSPTEFLVAAQSGMSFPVVADSIARRARQFGGRLPVATQHAALIPAVLRDFPIDGGCDRWDRMLASYYGGDAGLEKIVNDLKAALKPQWAMARAEDAKSTAGRRQEDHASLASRTLQAITGGGAYYNLPVLVRQLVAATNPTGQPGQNSLNQAHLRYRAIERRLAALRPDRNPF